MSNLIEQATRRLDELRRAGVAIPVVSPPSRPATPLVAAVPAPPPEVPDQLPTLAPVSPAGAPGSRAVDLNFAALAEQGILNPFSPGGRLGDDLAIIKMGVLNNVEQAAKQGLARGNIVLVTSALPSEGKTHFAINLALSLAMAVDHSVLLVDADVVRPAVLARLGVDPGSGLIDLLLDPALVPSSVLIATNVPKLTLLAPGTSNEKASELVASAAMSDLLDALASGQPDQIIVVDSPPLLVTTVARTLAPVAGQGVVVVEASKTSRASVNEAFAILGACRFVSAVLNNAEGFAGPGDNASSRGYY